MDQSGEALLIKMLGIGSITRIIGRLKKENVDLNKVQFLTFHSNRELCEILEIPQAIYVDNSRWYRLPGSLWKVYLQTRKKNFNSIVDFERSSNLMGIFREFLCLGLTVKNISFYNNKSDKVLGDRHQYKLKDRSMNDLIMFSVPHLPKTDEKIHYPLTDPLVENKILVNVNASDYLLARRYPLAQFATVIKGLRNLCPDAHIHLLGISGEHHYVQSLIDQHLNGIPGISNECGKWNLKQLTQELKTSRLIITNDSGPMHLAASTNTPVVAIWGPTSPEAFGYTNQENIRNIQTGIACSPCFTYPKSKAAKACKGRIDCMTAISPQSVLNAASELLVREEAVV